MTRLLPRLPMISISRTVSAVAVFSRFIAATVSLNRERRYRERAGGTKLATAYLVVAKIFVAAVAAYRAYEQLAGCNEQRGSCCGRCMACQVWH